jgi:threonine/homoserine/homoserine lactone efflux protein
MSFVWVCLAGVVCAFIGSLPLAGPIALLVVSNAISGRYREALKIALGAALAEGIYACLAFWGFAELPTHYGLVLPISQGVTATLLLGVGARFLFFEVKEEARGMADIDRGGRFWLGFSISALNPTLLATWGAVTTFLYAKQLVQFIPILAIPFGACVVAGVGLWGLMTVTLLKLYGHTLPKAALTWLVRAMGIILIGAGIWSAVQLVRSVTQPPASHSGGGEGRESICMRAANTWRILRADERVPLVFGCRLHEPRRVCGGWIAGGRGGG